MSGYFASVEALARRLGVTVASLLALREADDLDDEHLVAYSAAAVLAANVRAASLADLAVAADLSRALRRPVAPLGIRLPDGERERLTGALATIVTGEPGDDPARAVERRAMRVGRLADAEPRNTAQRVRGEAIGRSRHAAGWTRATNPGACKACVGLANGTVLSPRTSMWTHVGCGCAQRPTTRED